MKLKHWQKSLLTLALLLVLAVVVYSTLRQDATSDPTASGSQPTIGSSGNGTIDLPIYVPGVEDSSQDPNEPDKSDPSNLPGEPDTGDTSNVPEVPDNGDTSNVPEVPDNEDTPNLPDEPEGNQTPGNLPEDGSYTSKEDVALYLHQYGHLPDNFITKKEAEALGWPGGSLEPYAPGKCIGGDRFGNREGLLPSAQGRSYTECDIDTLGARSRGAKRIVFSNDGLIYYTEDHYESFELLYGDAEG